jgi:isochorismate hydrolase
MGARTSVTAVLTYMGTAYAGASTDGVSANIAVNGTAIEAMNLGYRVVVPSDGIAGDPPEYVEQLLRYTIRNVALVTTIETIVGHWASLPAGS